MVTASSLAFTEPGQCVDKTEIEFGFIGEGFGESSRVESQEKFIELGSGDGATGVLDRDARFLADEIEGSFAGGTEGFVALEIEEPILEGAALCSDLTGGC